MQKPIDFTRIRGDAAPAKRDYFEQLVCHLARLAGAGRFLRVDGAGGDGGVEALRILPGEKIGYQAKYYPVASKIDWVALDDSVITALTQHSDLTGYVIALPCLFTGKRAISGGSTEGTWGKWDARVASWKALAQQRGMAVDFTPWTAFELEAALMDPQAHYLHRFFFDQLTFSAHWMQEHAERTLAELQARYSPLDHVHTSSLAPFEVAFRRPSVCDHLHAVFDTARQSHPQAAARLAPAPALPVAVLDEVAVLLRQFDELEEAVESPFDQPWPVYRWFASWHSLTSALNDLSHQLSSAAKPRFRERIWQLTAAHELNRPEVFGGSWARQLPIDALRAVMLVGRAGEGKSHTLAQAVQDARNAGAPRIHILGQHMQEADPRMSILARLGLGGWTFDEFLSALNLAAEAAKTRALLVIDALNEGRGIEIWRRHLAGLIHDVNRYDRIVLVMSCREEYLEYVVEPGLVAEPAVYPAHEGVPRDHRAPLGKLVSFRIHGFTGAQEQENALRQFMDKNGIARPTAPQLDPEFFNPLFMSSVCRAMAKAGLTVFPDGLHGTRDMFGFVLDAKAKALGTPYDGTDKMAAGLRAALNRLAGHMAAQQLDHVPLATATHLIEEELRAFPHHRKWLDVFEGADLLRRDVEGPAPAPGDWAMPNEVVRFTFQRLQDNLVADHLSRHGGAIETAFAPGGAWAFLLKHTATPSGASSVRPAAKWAGVLGALWACVAEVHGKELLDLDSLRDLAAAQPFPRGFRAIFHASIRERRLTAFSGRTKSVLDLAYASQPVEKLGIYLAASCIPRHPWNADFIDARLKEFTPEQLAKGWSDHVVGGRFALRSDVGRITSWARAVPQHGAHPEVKRLAATILGWLAMVDDPATATDAGEALKVLNAC